MGKKHRKNRGVKLVVVTPSLESPICPVCGKADRLTECMAADDTGGPLYECCRCWIRFMIEDSRVEIEEDDDDAEALANMGSVAARDFNEPRGLKCAICQGKGCEVCQKVEKKKKPDVDYQTEPLFGEVEELTDAVAKRS